MRQVDSIEHFFNVDCMHFIETKLTEGWGRVVLQSVPIKLAGGGVLSRLDEWQIMIRHEVFEPE